MTTNRVPIARRSSVQITAAALAAFRKLRVLEVGCDAWWDAQFEIHRELGLRPWEMAIDWPGLGEWQPDEAAVARWRMFEEAAKPIDDSRDLNLEDIPKSKRPKTATNPKGASPCNSFTAKESNATTDRTD